MTAATRRRAVRRAERGSYLLTRTLGDVAAYQRGGFLGLGKRLARRPVRRAVGRATRGWL
jgi:hypothetical protein